MLEQICNERGLVALSAAMAASSGPAVVLSASDLMKFQGRRLFGEEKVESAGRK